ncbi:MAG: hypothetical protein ACREUT_06655, partial [Steroidobacteraceae bacterium]
MACTAPASVCSDPVAGGVALISDGRPAALIVDAADYLGVVRAARDLRGDLSTVAGAPAEVRVTRGTGPAASAERVPSGSERGSRGARPPILIGTLGHSPLIDQLVRLGKLNVGRVQGRWEAYVRQIVVAPMPGVPRALVLAGADKRGTIFAIYDLSRQIGVSPWVW